MERLVDLLYRFKHLGIEKTKSGAILIGRAPHIAPEAWLNSIYPCLNDDDIQNLEKELKIEIPADYKYFLKNISNGLTILVRVFTLDGLRSNYDRSIDASRQPFALDITNIHERPRNAHKNHFFIGGYSWDGSNLYIDTVTNKVHFCDRWDVTSLYEWNSFEDMLVSEIERIYMLYDKNGVKINEDMWTTPIER